MQFPSPDPIPSLAGVSVLLVDDDVEGCEFMRVVLERAGALVLVAHSCADAQRWIGRVRVDALLCDFHLPDGDGFELMCLARLDPGYRAHPARGILLSSSDEVDRRTAAAVGYVRVLTKPIPPLTLARTVAELTGGAD
jgi:CheY-like chemotaxis protein